MTLGSRRRSSLAEGDWFQETQFRFSTRSAWLGEFFDLPLANKQFELKLSN
jgi:hypothetical protein